MLLDPPLAVEVGDAGVLVGRTDRGIDEVLAFCLRCIRHRNTLLGLRLHPRFEWRAHREDGISALDSTFNRCTIAKIPGNDLGSELGQLGAEIRSEEHTSELQSPCNLVCRLLLEKKK